MDFLPLGNAFFAAILVLGMTTGAYQTQIFKGAILSLPQGQLKAARSLGMNDISAITSIILPQALRFSIPAWSNEYSIVLKDSALAYVIGVAGIDVQNPVRGGHHPQTPALYPVCRTDLFYTDLDWGQGT